MRSFIQEGEQVHEEAEVSHNTRVWGPINRAAL